jgi:hypothetical protein
LGQKFETTCQLSFLSKLHFLHWSQSSWMSRNISKMSDNHLMSCETWQ